MYYNNKGRFKKVLNLVLKYAPASFWAIYYTILTTSCQPFGI